MATAPPPRRPSPPGPTDHRFAEPTPFARLAITHAASICGDVCLTVSLAGSLFFSVSPGQLREKVLLYLIITMAPFAVIAPLLSPLLDRIRGGRRLMILATYTVRGLLCLFIPRYVNASGAEALLIYPLAFGLLVMQKTYSIARSALVPSLVSGEGELVTANSRLAIIAVVGGFVGGLPAIGVYKLFGAEGSLILAALVYALAAMLSWQIPRVEREQVGPDTKLEKEELHAPSIVLAGSTMGLLPARSVPHVLPRLRAPQQRRGAVGVRPRPRPQRRRRVPRQSLGAPAAQGRPRGGHPRRLARAPGGGVLVRGSLGVARDDDVRGIAHRRRRCRGTRRLRQPAPRDAPDAIRGRSFARFETRFQITWVAGALIPVAIPPVYQDLRIGLFVLAIGLGFAGLSYIAGVRPLPRSRSASPPSHGAHPGDGPHGFRAGLARLRHPGRRARAGGEPSKGRGEIEAGS